MILQRLLLFVSALVSVTLWASACGDGTTEPPPDPPRPTTVKVSPAATELVALGATVQLSAEVQDQNGQVMAGATVTWASSAAAVATVDASGLVTAVADGSATITATAGSASGSATVLVAQEVTAVAVAPDTATVVGGDTLRLAATATDANGHIVPAVEFAWASADTAVAVVDTSGLVTGVDTGQAEVMAAAAGATGRAELTVVAPAPTTVAVTPDTLVLTALGLTAQLTTEVRDQVGRVMDGVPVAWSSADTTIAVVDSSGLVRAAGSGAVTITAGTSEVSGDALVTVMQSVGSVTVSPPADTIALGDTLRLMAEALDANGHVVDGALFTWSSSNGLAAPVNASGRVRGFAEGTTTITATAGDASGTSEITVTNPDQATLVALYGATDGPNWVDNENWLTDAPLGEWYGVDTGVFGRVSRLDLNRYEPGVGWLSNGLTGAIPPEVGNLARLTTLNLENNNLTGRIPPELGNLVRLRELRVRGNDLTGPIPPELGNLVELREMGLSNNDLTGPIPPELGNLAGLSWLFLSNNDLTGPIPLELGNLAKLSRLHLSNNDLTGPIPLELGNLVELRHLYLDRINLTGPIPSELGDLARLRVLYLSHNYLTGPIPPRLGELPELTVLYLNDNNLSGPIPPELGNLDKLTVLGLGSTDLTGPIPPELGNLDEMWQLRLQDNNLTGAIPPELGDLVKLTNLDLGNNALTGPIPTELGNLAAMWDLRLQDNRLTGPIPQSFLQLEPQAFLVSGQDACIAGASEFVAWFEGIGNRDTGAGIFCNAADVAALRALYDGTDGAAWAESRGWSGDGPVEEWYGVTADSLGHVTELDLEGNGLTGNLPIVLGDMTQMAVLRIADNALSGRLPLSLTGLPLLEFRYSETELCAPAEASFRVWLNAIASLEGTEVDCVPLSDRDILKIFHDATGGPNWIDQNNWLTDAPLRDWYGVTVDGEGQVSGLSLWNNSLTGRLPPELGNLAELTYLRLSYNDLTGPIPPQLGNLAELTYLWLTSNDLTGPIPPELGNLAALTSLGLESNGLTGSIPPELGNLTKLTSLGLWNNGLTGSIPPELGNLAELTYLWLTSNDLTGPIPPELGNLAALTFLGLESNGLTGPIPPELGNLAELTSLWLSYNDLTGPIPPELGNLAALTSLVLWRNGLTGAIPPELGDLAALTSLGLGSNDLTGSIPPELGNLAELTYLGLSSNDLTGPIPPELENLTELTSLQLGSNDLTGQLPSELGSLANLWRLDLTSNSLLGSVPPEMGGMASVRFLEFTNNPGLAGALPQSLTGLARLESLLADGTGLCAPTDAAFELWLDRLPRQRIAPCATGGLPTAYLTQAVQSREFPVPLVAGEKALLRVFPTARQATSAGIPLVRARFYVGGREPHVQDIPGKSTPIPTKVAEGDLFRSANAEIAGWVIQPGLEMVIEVDPDSTLDLELGVAKRIPATGRLAVAVKTMPLFDLALIPFVWTTTHDSSIVDLVGAMGADAEHHEMLSDVNTLLPIGALRVTAHEAVLSSSNNAYALFAQTKMIRVMEGGTGHYMGMMSRPRTGPDGVGELPGRSSFSHPVPGTIAHELGHNLSLGHAPCGDPPGPDPSYPYPNGYIGAWGYDFRDGGRLVRPSTPELMSYCGPKWISDYYFANALRYRLFDEAAVSTATRSLLLWGGVGADSVLYLEPAFVVDAPAGLPDSMGEYRVVGRTTDGSELFSLSFTMPQVADGDGSSSFAFALPVRAGWEDRLATITLSGPEGSVTLDGKSEIPMAILRNPNTGQVRGILRDPPSTTETAADGVGVLAPGLEVLFSRGIPGATAWRR